MRTAASSTTLNSDGTWTLTSYPVPVHYQDAQGNWQNIDDTVVTDSSVSGYGYGNKANGWQVHFAQQAGGSKLLHLRYPGLTVAEALNGAATVSATASGSQIIYPSVFPSVLICSIWSAMPISKKRFCSTLRRHLAAIASPITFPARLPGRRCRQYCLPGHAR